MSTPTLGYPSRTAAIFALQDQGMSQLAIAEKIGISANAVSGLIASAQRGPRHIDEPKADDIDQSIKRMFRPHAARRGISVDQLIDRIIYTVATEGLVDAVLDDRGAGAA